jgi:hypothetical protein
MVCVCDRLGVLEELDLWRGDMLKTTKTSVRCLQDDTKPLIVPTKVENNIIINKPMEKQPNLWLV